MYILVVSSFQALLLERENTCSSRGSLPLNEAMNQHRPLANHRLNRLSLVRCTALVSAARGRTNTTTTTTDLPEDEFGLTCLLCVLHSVLCTHTFGVPASAFTAVFCTRNVRFCVVVVLSALQNLISQNPPSVLSRNVANGGRVCVGSVRKSPTTYVNFNFKIVYVFPTRTQTAASSTFFFLIHSSTSAGRLEL